MLTLLFILFGALAIGCALAMVAQRNPLYSAISLIGVFISLACLYVMLAAPFIAAVQVIVYAGAIMVLVVFVIMLLNAEQEERRRGVFSCFCFHGAQVVRPRTRINHR